VKNRILYNYDQGSRDSCAILRQRNRQLTAIYGGLHFDLGGSGNSRLSGGFPTSQPIRDLLQSKPITASGSVQVGLGRATNERLDSFELDDSVSSVWGGTYR
jgi:hypothetical protein